MNFRFRIVVISVFMLLILAGCTSASAANEIPSATPLPTATATVTPEWFANMTATPWPPLTETPFPVGAGAPSASNGTLSAEGNLPVRITDLHGTIMLLIPEGEFTMGSETGFPDEVPVHKVWVDAYYLDLLEVTNKAYKACVDAGACESPRRTDCCTEEPGAYVAWPEYFGNPEFDNHPVIFITWYDAYDYCTWRGARLATEAEWEKASRGTDERTYPWGNDEPNPDLINFLWTDEFPDRRPLYTTSPVGSYPLGASPYGILDLAGNVYEWLWDRYDPDYYARSPYENPQGPDDGEYRLTRGGSFWNQAFRNRSANRNNAFIPADSFHFDGGARCAIDPSGTTNTNN
jgi:eukaryotic-like serine/threonine-protein kinase